MEQICLSYSIFTLKRHLDIFWTKFDKSCQCAALQTNEKRQQKSDPLPPSNLTILDPCPTLLTCYSCAQKKKSKSDCDEYSK